ncbi:hypothetical protein NPIL_162931 [Nephila pilipes]|uniref:Uncharacterized protein n=1 Tax=Nephila pilipes TaxID=299642 RepID=A0A8X6Q6X7_NEPPI|nr:hypothetical protein NPIL_162931 [Nephila pilipes]
MILPSDFGSKEDCDFIQTSPNTSRRDGWRQRIESSYQQRWSGRVATLCISNDRKHVVSLNCECCGPRHGIPGNASSSEESSGSKKRRNARVQSCGAQYFFRGRFRQRIDPGKSKGMARCYVLQGQQGRFEHGHAGGGSHCGRPRYPGRVNVSWLGQDRHGYRIRSNGTIREYICNDDDPVSNEQIPPRSFLG